MPHYEYVCTNGHRTEVVHGINAPGPETCPICGAPMRKAFIAPTIHFKGSGWAKVDRRSSSRSKARDAEEAPVTAVADSTSSSGGDSQSDSKDATKDATKDTAKDTAKDTTPASSSATDRPARTAPTPPPKTKSAATD